MALLTKFGTLNVPATSKENGTTAITGLGFQPKAIIFTASGKNGDGNNTIHSPMLGFTTGPTENVVSTTYAYTSQGNARNTGIDTLCIKLMAEGNANYFADARLDSFDADGFTLYWTDIGFYTGRDGYEIHYLALGGDDVANAKAMYFAPSGSTGSQSVTTGFEPNTLLFTAARTNDGNIYTPQSLQTMGVATPAAQWVQTLTFEYGSNGTNSAQYTDAAIHVMNKDGVTEGHASVSSFDATGFTLSWTDPALAADAHYVLALDLATPPAVGTVTQSATAAQQSESGLGLTPSAAYVGSWGFPSGTNLQQTTAHQMQHWTDGSAAVGYATGARELSGLIYARQSVTTPLVILDQVGGVIATGSSTLVTDGFTLDWATTDGTQRELTYLVFGEGASGETHDGIAILDASTDFAALAHRTRDNGLTAASLADLLTTGSAIFDVPHTATGETAFSPTPSRVRATTIAYDAQSVLLAETGVTRLGSVTLVAESDLTLLSDGLQGRATFEGEATFLIVPNRIRYGIPIIPLRQSDLTVSAMRDRSGVTFDVSASAEVAYINRVEYDSAFTLAGTTEADIAATLVASGQAAYIGAGDLDLNGGAVRITTLSLTADTDLTASHDRVRNAILEVDGTAGIVTIVTARTRGQTFRPHGTLDFAAHAHADFNGWLRADAILRESMRETRVRNDAMTADATSAFTPEPLRVRGTALHAQAGTTLDTVASLIATGVLTTESIIGIDVIPAAILDGRTSLDATSNLAAYATPLLQITYHDVKGRVHTRLARVDVNARPFARVRRLPPTKE